ncbi:unnamed protein product, partial [Ectocarpus sp. 8 AP-2014]
VFIRLSYLPAHFEFHAHRPDCLQFRTPDSFQIDWTLPLPLRLHIHVAVGVSLHSLSIWNSRSFAALPVTLGRFITLSLRSLSGSHALLCDHTRSLLSLCISHAAPSSKYCCGPVRDFCKILHLRSPILRFPDLGNLRSYLALFLAHAL